MASIDKLRASDGTGNASVATVQTTRSGGASTIIVDTVLGINGNFMGTMGTPHTFTDPITSETITVISEATAVDFSGHVDGSNLEIDAIAPGYTDNGSAVGDIIIIRPTTQGQNELADVLDVAHQDSGKLKTTSLDEFYKPSDNSGSWVVSGGAVAQTSGLTGSFSDIVYYVLGLRYTRTSVANKLYLASKDTYVDIGIDGTVDYNDVANGATAPVLAANHIRIAKVVTNGSAITSVVQTGIDNLGNSIYNVGSQFVEKIFTTAGANTYTKPEGLKYVIVEVVGGGGGGGGNAATSGVQVSVGSGGGGGGYSRKKILASALGTTETVTVGAAGSSGSGASGGTGGTSSFGSHCSASGGLGGVLNTGNTSGGTYQPGNTGGSGTGGDLNITGGPGFMAGTFTISNNVAYGGNGGNSPLGFGFGGRGMNANNAGGAATGYGGGGGGAAASTSVGAQTGGAATGGIVIIREYF